MFAILWLFESKRIAPPLLLAKEPVKLQSVMLPFEDIQ